MMLLPPYPHWSRRFRTELALLGALLFHALLFLLLRAPAAAPAPPRPRGVEIATLPLASREPQAQALLAWADLVEPTLLVLAEPQRGFSRWLRAPRPQPLGAWPAMPVALAPLPQLPAPGAEPLPAPPDGVAAALQEQWRIRHPPPEETGAAAPPSAAPLPAGVGWRLADGTPLAGVELDLAAARAEQARHPARQPSRFGVQLSGPGVPSRLRLMESSGTPGLDQLAYVALGRAMLVWERRPPPGRFSEPARQETVEVEWRLLAPAAAP